MDIDGNNTSPPRSPDRSPAGELSAAGRPVRTKRPTWKILQNLPQPPVPCPAPAPPPDVEVEPNHDSDSDTTPFVWQGIRTALNSFGLFREYPSVPTYNPDATLSSNNTQFTNPRNVPTTESAAPIPDENSSSSYSFRNTTIGGLVSWLWTGSATKSIEEMEKLVEFMQSDDFKKEDLMGFNIRKETAQFDASLAPDADNPLAAKDGWEEDPVDIEVPDGKSHEDDPNFTRNIYSVPGLFHRSLVEVIRTAITDAGARCFHYTPFKQFWQPDPDSPPQRVYDEIYSSDAMIEEHVKLQGQPPEPGCTLERVILAMMVWSDSTHLANFGSASLWPIYLFFGNQSKWLRGKPRAGACHHVAYMPKVSLQVLSTNTLFSKYFPSFRMRSTIMSKT